MDNPVAISIKTMSKTMSYPWTEKPTLPEVTIAEQTIAPPAVAGSPTGYRILVIDPTLVITDPASIRLNAVVQIIPETKSHLWVETYADTYYDMVKRILNSGDPSNYLLIAASFGLDVFMGPTNDFLEVLLGAGAGKPVQNWLTKYDPGSQSSDPTSWVGTPANYLFIGLSGSPYGGAVGELSEVGSYNTPLSSTLKVPLTR